MQLAESHELILLYASVAVLTGIVFLFSHIKQRSRLNQSNSRTDLFSNDQIKTILEALDSYGEKGCGIISLSLETGFRQESLRRFFKKIKPISAQLIMNLNTN